ncbi:MAG: hypothetical protein AAB787_02770 [Patescibacteria group bacterium]
MAEDKSSKVAPSGDGNRKKQKQAWAAALGALDVPIRKAAQAIASKIPPESFLRNEGLETIVGSLKGLVESSSEDLHPFIAACIERGTDFMDAFSTALAYTGHPQHEAVKATLDGWRAKFFANAQKRLQRAGKNQIESETAKIKAEFDAAIAVLAYIEEKAEKESATLDNEKPSHDWNDDWMKFEKKLASLLNISANYLKDLPGAESGSLMEVWKLFRPKSKNPQGATVNTATTASPAGPAVGPNTNQPAGPTGTTPNTAAPQNPPPIPPTGGSGGGTGNTGGAWSNFMINITSIWNVATFWVRLAIVFFLAWPPVIDWIANAVKINGGSPDITRFFSFFPAIVLVGLLLTRLNPIALGTINALERQLGLRFFSALTTSIAALVPFGFFLGKWPMSFNLFMIFEAGILTWAINRFGARNGMVSLVGSCMVIFALGSAMTNQTTIGTIVSGSGKMFAAELSPNGDEPIPGSSSELAIPVPCAEENCEDCDQTLEEMGAANFSQTRIAYFSLDPGCASPVILVPESCIGFGKSYVLSIGPTNGSYMSRYKQNGKWSGWYRVSRSEPVKVPLDATARQWKNIGDETKIIVPKMLKR